jgi:DNA-binding transcriptional MerR regulator
MTLRLYRAAEVCELAELQPYVLRSWEKEFPGIGVQRSPDGPRLYRQADLDQVRRIKQLVFDEGLTVGGARRRLEEASPVPVSEAEAAEVLSTLGSKARSKIDRVRETLRSLQSMLAEKPGEFRLQAPAAKEPARTEKRDAAPKLQSSGGKRGLIGKVGPEKGVRTGTPVRPKVTVKTVAAQRLAPRKSGTAKRRRASA